LIVHYDGSSWSVAKTPHSKKWERSLTAIHARGATEAWAAGYEFKKSKPANRRPLALTWDGSKWTKVAIPSPGSNSGLTGVFQLANNDVVAVGNRLVSGNAQSFNENYNHSAWKLPPTATTGGPTDSLTSLYYTTAAGSYTDTEGNVHPLVEREQGGGGYFSPGWDLQPAPDGPMGNSYFNDVWAGFNGAGPWAVGVQVGPNSTTFVPDLHTLIEHYDCTSESPSPSSSVTPSASVTPSPMDSPSPSPADSPSSTESPTPTP
jgi:hypothetical protein